MKFRRTLPTCGVLLLGVSMFAQTPKAPEKPAKISIADSKYELLQLRLAVAIKDAQNAQLQAQNVTQQITAPSVAALNAEIIKTLKALGYTEEDAMHYVYDPSTFTFTRKPDNAPQTAIPASTDKK